MEVEAYLRRLEIDSPGEPTYALLEVLERQHLLKVPFENLDIHRGIPIVLEEARLLQKIVAAGRGGFCYELNGAFAWLLSRLGYPVTLLAAEVARADGSFGIPFDHLTLRVDLDRPYIVDVGFGESSRAPLPLDGTAVSDPWGDRYRVARRGDVLFVERADAAGKFGPQYRFTLTPRALADFNGGCHYHQTSPASTFTKRPLCTRALPEGRITLLPDRLVDTDRGAKRESPIADHTAWLHALKQHFGIVLEG